MPEPAQPEIRSQPKRPADKKPFPSAPCTEGISRGSSCGVWDVTVFTVEKTSWVKTAGHEAYLRVPGDSSYVMLEKDGMPHTFLSTNYPDRDNLAVAELWRGLQYSDNRQFEAAWGLINLSASRREIRPLLEGVGAEMLEVLAEPSGQNLEAKAQQQVNAILVLAALGNEGVMKEDRSYINSCGDTKPLVANRLVELHLAGRAFLRPTLEKFGSDLLNDHESFSGPQDEQALLGQANTVGILSWLKGKGIDAGMPKNVSTFEIGYMINMYRNGADFLQIALQYYGKKLLNMARNPEGNSDMEKARYQQAVLHFLNGIVQSGIEVEDRSEVKDAEMGGGGNGNG